MAHEVEIINGQAQLAYAGELPWHGLGVRVSDDMTPEQMMEAAGLNWGVEKRETYVRVGNQVIKTGIQALMRDSDNKVLTHVGKGWNPVQNAEAFEFFQDFVSNGDMQMHTAGSLKGGKVVWALAKVNDSFEILGQDRVDSYLLFSNPHEYGKCVDVRFTPIRVVCNNTLTYSLSQNVTNSFRLNHSAAFNAEIVKEGLGIAKVKMQQYKEASEFLATKMVSPEKLLEFYGLVLPKTSGVKEINGYDDLSRNAKLAYDNLNTQPGGEFAPNSWWNAFNSVTFLTDHLQGRSADNRMHSAWFGVNRARKVTAMQKALEFANAA